jgi:hypothetical protein
MQIKNQKILIANIFMDFIYSNKFIELNISTKRQIYNFLKTKLEKNLLEYKNFLKIFQENFIKKNEISGTKVFF